MSTVSRELAKVYKPVTQAGFLGKGHTARPVIGVDFKDSDPFIMLMDDMLEKKDNIPVGGPHPHAGFETVTLVLEGEIGEGEHAMRGGDFEMMTAGSGIIHTETISQPSRMRILQLWLNLPKEQRKAQPRIQRLKAEHVPYSLQDGVSVKVYSGSFAGEQSPILNHTPLLLAQVKMEPNTVTIEKVPANYSTFLYVLNGSITVGGTTLAVDHVGWLDRYADEKESIVEIKAGEQGAHFVLYAAEPQQHEIVSHGPFIADSMEDIRQLYSDYRAGKIGHISDVASEQQFSY